MRPKEWWAEYREDVPCVFGHDALKPDKAHVFGKAVCVDYGSSYRSAERSAPGFDGRFQNRLAAARFPEGHVVFDDGSCEALSP